MPLGDRPELDQPPAVILSYFGEQDTVILGSFLLMLAAVAFIWFAGSLRSVLRRKEGGEGRLSTIAFGGGVAAGVRRVEAVTGTGAYDHYR